MMKKGFLGICFVLLVAVAVGACTLLLNAFNLKETAYVYVDADDTVDSVYSKISAVAEPQAFIGSSGFKLMSTLKRFNKPRTGKYAIEPGMNMFTCVRHLANGSQVPVNLTVPEVRTVADMIQRLASQLMISEDEIQAAVADKAFMDSLGYDEANIPCLFVPNTYEIYWNTSAKGLLSRLDKEKKAFWTDERIAKAKQIGMTPNQVVTLASIVESETSYGPEKATVAGLYIHRMQIDMPLQSDPTVIFAIGDFNIHRVTLEQTRYDSPYNTYLNNGLPPGPIRIPSIQGIDAVLNYDHNDYVYMCAKEDFSGSHNFTSSYSEHLANARRYQQALNRRGIMK